jgi:hypothetical protein
MVRKVVVLLTLASVAGCGGGTAGPNTTTSVQQIRTAWLAYSDCVRHHGVPDFPDMRVDDSGRVIADDDAPRVPDAAIRACQDLVAAVPDWSAQTPPPSAGVLAKLRQYAQCMRRNGYPQWPDPAADGTFTLAQGQDAKQVLSHEPTECHALAPGGGVRLRAG